MPGRVSVPNLSKTIFGKTKTVLKGLSQKVPLKRGPFEEYLE